MQVKHTPSAPDMVAAVRLHIWQVAIVVRPFDFGLRISDLKAGPKACPPLADSGFRGLPASGGAEGDQDSGF